MTAPAPYRQKHTDEELHSICRKCQGVRGLHFLTCPTLRLPQDVPLYDEAATR